MRILNYARMFPFAGLLEVFENDVKTYGTET